MTLDRFCPLSKDRETCSQYCGWFNISHEMCGIRLIATSIDYHVGKLVEDKGNE